MEFSKRTRDNINRYYDFDSDYKAESKAADKEEKHNKNKEPEVKDSFLENLYSEEE